MSDVLDLSAAGLASPDVQAELPDLEPADLAARLRFTSRRLDQPVLAASAMTAVLVNAQLSPQLVASVSEALSVDAHARRRPPHP